MNIVLTFAFWHDCQCAAQRRFSMTPAAQDVLRHNSLGSLDTIPQFRHQYLRFHNLCRLLAEGSRQDAEERAKQTTAADRSCNNRDPKTSPLKEANPLISEATCKDVIQGTDLTASLDQLLSVPAGKEHSRDGMIVSHAPERLR